MYTDEYKRWLAQNLEDGDLKPELEAIGASDDQIKERFAANLQFGTAGLRGIIGAGTNRMNIYTVRRATQGLANFLLAQNPKASVAISFDSRIKSDLFAREVARVLAASGVTAHLYPQLEPVPLLSYAVRSLGTSAGVMITASHNPAKYNGYKVYGPDGCQMSTGDSAAVTREIEKLDIFSDVKTMDFDLARTQGLILDIKDDVLEGYYAAVKAQSVRPGLVAQSGFKLVYSPLNGSGNVPVRRVLGDVGLRDITVVPQQEMPDGNFPTCPYPNPEVRESLELGLRLAQEIGADLMLATDPDADRVGIAVRDNTGEYHLLSGNEVGVLLLHYISKGRSELHSMPQNPLTVRSIVSTPMADAVAKSYGVEMVHVLTGFKYIGEQILKLEQKGEKERFIFGFEESYGYLAGTHVRDKDAVVASMLICEMAAWYKTQGTSLYEGLAALYDEYGHYHNAVDSFTFEGLAGMETMAGIMRDLRAQPPADIAGKSIIQIADYEKQEIKDLLTNRVSTLDLPTADVLTYTLEDNSVVIVRPSGTEPKIKVYYTTRSNTMEKAETIQQELAAAMKALIL